MTPTLAYILITAVLLAGVASIRALPRKKRPPAWGAAAALLIFAAPVLPWIPYQLSIDFTRPVRYPEGFKDRLYFDRYYEKKQLPVNRDALIADREYKVRNPGVARVAILGDSFAAGYGIPYGDTLGVRLQKELGSKYEVINGAFFGTNTEMQVEYFFMRIAKYRPRAIILRHRVDDLMPLDEKYHMMRIRRIIEKWAPHWPRAMKNAVFQKEVYFMRGRFWAEYRKNPRRHIKYNQEHLLDRLEKYTSKGGVRVLVLVDDCGGGDYERICRDLERQSRSYGWSVMRARSKADFADPRMTIPGDGHPTGVANQSLADRISRTIREWKLGETAASR